MIRNFVPNLWSKKLNPPRIGVVLTVVSFSFSKAALVLTKRFSGNKIIEILSLSLSLSLARMKRLNNADDITLCDGIFEKNFDFERTTSETLNPNFREDAFLF